MTWLELTRVPSGGRTDTPILIKTDEICYIEPGWPGAILHLIGDREPINVREPYEQIKVKVLI